MKKTITFRFTTVYPSLYKRFSWFCSFHSASVPGDFPSSHRISPFHYSFQHNSIPSPAYTTICSAIPQLKGVPSFSNFFATTESAAMNIFVQVILFMTSLGYRPSSVMAGSKHLFFSPWRTAFPTSPNHHPPSSLSRESTSYIQLSPYILSTYCEAPIFSPVLLIEALGRSFCLQNNQPLSRGNSKVVVTERKGCWERTIMPILSINGAAK